MPPLVWIILVGIILFGLVMFIFSPNGLNIIPTNAESTARAQAILVEAQSRARIEEDWNRTQIAIQQQNAQQDIITRETTRYMMLQTQQNLTFWSNVILGVIILAIVLFVIGLVVSYFVYMSREKNRLVDYSYNNNNRFNDYENENLIYDSRQECIYPYKRESKSRRGITVYRS